MDASNQGNQRREVLFIISFETRECKRARNSEKKNESIQYIQQQSPSFDYREKEYCMRILYETCKNTPRC